MVVEARVKCEFACVGRVKRRRDRLRYLDVCEPETPPKADEVIAEESELLEPVGVKAGREKENLAGSVGQAPLGLG